MQIIDVKDWTWVLFKNEDDVYLDVVCGTVALYSIIVQLNSKDLENYSSFGINYIHELASEIRTNSDSFKDRHTTTIDQKKIKKALEEYK